MLTVDREQSNTLKLCAVGLMLVDHVGAMLLPGVPWLRFLGRLSFPLFAVQLAVGYRYTHSVPGYLHRLFWLGVASQVPFMLAFGGSWWHLNIYATLLLGVLGCYAVDHGRWWLLPFVVAAAVTCDYGLYGVGLVLVFFVGGRWSLLPLWVLLEAFQFWTRPSIQPVALCALLLVLFTPRCRWRLPSWCFYWFYPVHLLLLVVLRFFCRGA